MLIKMKKIVSPLLKLRKATCALSTAVPKEERIKVGNCDINYLKVGHGEHKVVFVPGALGSIWTDFKPQVEGFDREKFTIVAWDPPGYGKSRPPEMKEFNADFFEKDADTLYTFMKALDIPKYSVVGWSDGGTSSLIHAAKYHDCVQKLVIISANSFILPHELKIYKTLRDISSWSKKMKQPMIDLYGEEMFAKYWSIWLDGQITVYNANNGDICSGILKDIKCPSFILYGEKDPIVDPIHVSHFHTNIAGSRVHLYPDGKHNIHLNYAKDFNERVQEFLLEP